MLTWKSKAYVSEVILSMKENVHIRKRLSHNM